MPNTTVTHVGHDLVCGEKPVWITDEWVCKGCGVTVLPAWAVIAAECKRQLAERIEACDHEEREMWELGEGGSRLVVESCRDCGCARGHDADCCVGPRAPFTDVQVCTEKWFHEDPVPSGWDVLDCPHPADAWWRFMGPVGVAVEICRTCLGVARGGTWVTVFDLVGEGANTTVASAR